MPDQQFNDRDNLFNCPVPYHSLSDPFSDLLNEFEERWREKELTWYASRLLEKAIRDETELEEALQRAITTLQATRHSANRHFKKIYIASGGMIRKDWLVSDLGLKLIIMNADRSNPVMVAWQVEILSNKSEIPEVRKSGSQ